MSRRNFLYFLSRCLELINSRDCNHLGRASFSILHFLCSRFQAPFIASPAFSLLDVQAIKTNLSMKVNLISKLREGFWLLTNINLHTKSITSESCKLKNYSLYKNAIQNTPINKSKFSKHF